MKMKAILECNILNCSIRERSAVNYWDPSRENGQKRYLEKLHEHLALSEKVQFRFLTTN